MLHSFQAEYQICFLFAFKNKSYRISRILWGKADLGSGWVHHRRICASGYQFLKLCSDLTNLIRKGFLRQGVFV